MLPDMVIFVTVVELRARDTNMTLQQLLDAQEQPQAEKPTLAQLLGGQQQGGLPQALEPKPVLPSSEIEKTFTQEVPTGAVGTLPSGEPQYAGDNAWEQYWNGV